MTQEMEFVNQIIRGDWIQVLRTLPGEIYHAVVTSPPFWGQRSYSWGGDGSCYDEKTKATIHKRWERFDDVLEVCVKCGAYRPIFGLEKTPEEHIEKLIEGFREVRRVLRDDGVVFLNYGDKYVGGGGYCPTAPSTTTSKSGRYGGNGVLLKGSNYHGLPNGNLLLLPARIALALQADGWYVRQKIIWAKAISLCDKYSGSCMPESVSGTYWQQHRVKVKSGWDKDLPHPSKHPGQKSSIRNSGDVFQAQAIWADCPGCPKCEAEGGLVLREGSGRCTSAYEEILMLTKGPGYYWDQEAVREDLVTDPSVLKARVEAGRKGNSRGDALSVEMWSKNTKQYEPSGRNPRSVWAVPQEIQDMFWAWLEANAGLLTDVWAINPKAYKEAHYATYPPKLVSTCVRAATSAKGVCAKCGKQWARIIASRQIKRERPSDRTDRHMQGQGVNSCGNTVAGIETQTLGWKATCKCDVGEAVPAVVLDPFGGSGTTGMTAAQLGRNWTIIEINPEYIYNQAQWRVIEGETGMRKQEAILQKALFD